MSSLPDTEDVEEDNALVEGDAMMTEEDSELVVLGHSDTVQVPWDHLDSDLLWGRRAECNHSGHPRVVEAVNLEEDNSFRVAGRLLEEDMRSDALLLLSSCSNII